MTKVTVYEYQGPGKYKKTSEFESSIPQVPDDFWCKCKDRTIDTPIIYKDNHECDCGIVKHHYHCVQCNKIVQIG